MTAPMNREELLAKIADIISDYYDEDDAGRWRKCAEQVASILPDSAQQPWQSIETAPKDGPAFLIWLPENLCIYEVIARDGNLSIFGGGFRDNLHRATLWQPLPVPPSNQGASK